MVSLFKQRDKEPLRINKELVKENVVRVQACAVGLTIW